MTSEKSEKRPIAFITGTSSGMGLVTTIELAKNGYHVIATMRNLERQAALVDAANSAGVADHIEIVTLDVSDDQAIVDVFARVYEKHGTIDLLVNNAGDADNGFTEEKELDSFRRVFDTNFFGVVATCKQVIPHMRQAGHGLIVNIASISAKLTFPGLTSYAASKAALEAFSESLRFELIPFGVHVALIHPGAYKTNIWEKGTEGIRTNPDSPYDPFRQRLDASMKHSAVHSADPIEIANKIVEIARSDYPEFRYIVPDSLRDEYYIRTVTPTKRIEKPFVDWFK